MKASPARRRITVFSTDVPYPATRGGRADIWRRLQALRQLGCDVQLISFFDDVAGGRPEASQIDVIRTQTTDVKLYPIRQGVRAMWHAMRQIPNRPWHVARRSISDRDLDHLTDSVRTFNPDLLWCEGPWCGGIYRSIQAATHKPLVYRSHNIEHVYMAKQASAARRLRDGLAWRIACLGLEKFERAMMQGADWVFDISSDDMAYWQAQGIQHISWLPPMAESALVPDGMQGCSATPEHDVLFLGNLTTPNNVRGVEWLVNEIRPLVLQQRPETRFVVAGSRPGPHLRDLCTAPGVVLMADVPDALALYRSARVLVNPVRTGSGTHVKAVEMLMMRAPIVTASQGTMGLPNDVKRLFKVADTAADFAAAILAALAAPTDAWDERAAARRLFGVGGLADALARLSTHLQMGHGAFAGRSVDDVPALRA